MAFTVYTPQTSRTLEPGMASLDRNGNLRFTREDAQAAQLAGVTAALLYDTGTRRIAVRKPRDGDVPLRMRSKSKGGVLLAGWTVNVAGALRALGVTDVKTCAGFYTATVKDDMVIIALGDLRHGRPLNTRRPPGRQRG